MVWPAPIWTRSPLNSQSSMQWIMTRLSGDRWNIGAKRTQILWCDPKTLTSRKTRLIKIYLMKRKNKFLCRKVTKSHLPEHMTPNVAAQIVAKSPRRYKNEYKLQDAVKHRVQNRNPSSRRFQITPYTEQNSKQTPHKMILNRRYVTTSKRRHTDNIDFRMPWYTKVQNRRRSSTSPYMTHFWEQWTPECQ